MVARIFISIGTACCHALLFTSHRNIPELQEQNQRLLMVIRDLSEQQEQREQEMMDETLVTFGAA